LSQEPFVAFSDLSLQFFQFLEVTNQTSILLPIEIASRGLQQPSFATQA
jgi:hypothetical protein